MGLRYLRSLNVMKANIQYILSVRRLWCVLLMLAHGVVHGQLITTGGQTPSVLLQNVLLGGGVQVSNITYSGATIAIGSFDGTASNIGLQSGIVMTTGNLDYPTGPPGPNNSTNAGIDNSAGGSALLEQFVNEDTYNATTLQFDFVPQGDTILFRYVFGSEEYKEYVGSTFNDIFGFFISGPNPAGGNYNNKNIAVIPNTNTFVAINNVNHLSNSNYYVDNESPFPGQTVQYDGFTKVLTAVAHVVPCSTYTLKLAIADVGDPFYDSGVFLEAKSFVSEGSDVSYTIVGGLSPDTLYEGCGEALVTFSWNGTTDVAHTVYFTVTGTATNGVDYTAMGTQVTIPAGQNTVTIPMQAFIDGIPEGTENITISINDPNACPNIVLPSITIPIKNTDPIDVNAMPDTAFNCNNQLVLLSASASGGVNPLTYTWSNGVGSGNNIPVIVRETTTFVVTVTDACGALVSEDSVAITVPNADSLTLRFTADTSICPGQEVLLLAEAAGGIGDITYSWSTGDINTDSVLVYPLQTTMYSIIVEDSCGNTVGASSLVLVKAPTADFGMFYIENQKIQFLNQSSSDVVSWYWNFGDGNWSTEESPLHAYADTGWFYVLLIVVNDYGCADTLVKAVYSYPPFVLFIPNTFTPTLDGLNEEFLTIGQGFVSFDMGIFDRWGRELFRTKDIHRGWNGKDERGNYYPLGVYVYRIDIVTPPGLKEKFLGRVTIIR
jgi:gliding motility-associated-like protein